MHNCLLSVYIDFLFLPDPHPHMLSQLKYEYILAAMILSCNIVAINWAYSSKHTDWMPTV